MNTNIERKEEESGQRDREGVAGGEEESQEKVGIGDVKGRGSHKKGVSDSIMSCGDFKGGGLTWCFCNSSDPGATLSE